MDTSAARTATTTTILDCDHGSNTTKEASATPSAQQRETSQYIADMVLELRNMAKSAKLYQVMVPLEYAYYEAFSVANRVDVPPGEAERIRALSRAADEAERL